MGQPILAAPRHTSNPPWDFKAQPLVSVSASKVIALGRTWESTVGRGFERNASHAALSIAVLQQRTLIAQIVTACGTCMALAQESNRPVEVARIRSVIAEMNKARKDSDARAFSEVFARDGSLRIGNEIIATGPNAIESVLKRPAWTEVTAPMIGNESVRFVSSDVALVDATQTRYGSLILKQSVPVTLLLKLEGQEWRVVSLWLHPFAADSLPRLNRSRFL